jgi:hypothetical protein
MTEMQPSPADLELRSRIAAALTRHPFPGTRDQLVAEAQGSAADDAVVGALRRLPDRQYEHLQDVADALGLGREDRGAGSSGVDQSGS